jgi:hypothetical protein
MAIYDLYGSASDDIDGARSLLESSLGIAFQARDSEYQGGRYFQWGLASGEHFVLKQNIDLVDGEPAEMAFPDQKILLYINDTPNSKELQEKIHRGAKTFALVRHEDLE